VKYYLIKKWCEDYKDYLEYNASAGSIWTIDERLGSIDDDAKNKVKADNLKKRFTINNYCEMVEKFLDEYMSGIYSYASPLVNYYPNKKLLEDAEGNKKTWKEIYTEILAMHRNGKSIKQMTKFFEKFKEVETAKPEKKAGGGKLEFVPNTIIDVLPTTKPINQPVKKDKK